MLFDWHELISELDGLPLEFCFAPLLAFRICGRPDAFIVFNFTPDQGVEEDCDFMSGGRGGRRRAESRFHSLEIDAHRGEAAMERMSGQAE